MLNLDLQIPNLPEALRDVAGIDDLVMDDAELTMRRSVDVIEAAVVQHTPVNFGELRDAWGTDVQRGQNVVRGVVANPLDYAEIVERGRRPGKWPPKDPIELWVKRKLGITEERKLKQVTFLVRRKIGTKGTPGAAMAFRGLQAVRPQVEADFAGIPARVAARFNE